MFGFLFGNVSNIVGQPHKYYVHSTGTGLRDKSFNTRREAEIYMQNYCAAAGIKLECTEYDRHERKYSDHNGTRFYINRI